MDIAFVQPFTDNLEPPISLAYLAGSLSRSGHRARIIDLQIPEIRKRWKEILAAEPVDLVGITAMTPQIHQASEIGVQIKGMMPDVPVIAGGAHPTLLPEKTLAEFPVFDLVVIGEGEQTVLEIASRKSRGEPITGGSVRGIAFRSNAGVVRTPPRDRINDLDLLPNPHEMYDFDYYLVHNSFSFTEKSASMIVSRGCPYQCKFCATKGMWTRKYVCTSTDGVIREIQYILNRGASGIVFRDSTFIINKRWVLELCEKIEKENLGLKWAINARVDQVEESLFLRMKKAGLDTVYFGVESGSQKILDFYGKGISLSQTEKAFEICRRLKINTGAYFMLGALPETREDMELTYRFVKKLKPSFSLVFIFMPLPGSELYDHYIEQGYEFDYSKIRSDKASFHSANLDIEELELLRENWYKEFNKKPNVVIRGFNSVMKIRSWHDLKKTGNKLSKYITGNKSV